MAKSKLEPLLGMILFAPGLFLYDGIEYLFVSCIICNEKS